MSSEAVAPGRRQAESERRRQAILAAARRCYGKLGYAGATVGTIAREAGVSNGLLYQFFRGKEHLVEVVIDELHRDWVRAMLPRDAADASAADALEGMFRRSVEFCRTHPLLPALLNNDRDLQLERLRRNVGARRIDAYRDHVAGLIRGGIEAGEFQPDLDVSSTADVVCQLQVDYSGRAYRRDPAFPSGAEVVDAAVRLVLDALRTRA
jgi:AcrR family transcriptional regulator